ncbi:MAG: TIGR00730 family Rossman fold protein [Candidatus Kapabacteria bacterium]|nr:TIGR00730 family Rossman fold protein [Ignavibacteriota bacterium]MCW5883732.1 TIGR00730 family Rossman fold protein [Candidatus Kapabacteria bacterium]
MKKKITVYCASSSNINEIYLESASKLGEMIALSGHEVVYGGGKVGLMGKLADGALRKGGKVTGIIPDFLMDLELGHSGVSKLIITKDLHERQRKMMDLADSIFVLPGGSGTFVELFEAVTWKRLGRIIIPIIIININNYFDTLIFALNKAIDEGFMRKEHFELWTVVDDIDSAVRTLHEKNSFVPFDIA